MKIEHLVHGDEKLWAKIGEFLASRSVHKEIGGPIYSVPGVHWWVAVERGKVAGFAALRVAGGAVHHDYAYVVEGKRRKGVHTALAAARDEFAAAEHPGLPAKILVRESRWKHYKKRGWDIATVRGQWVNAVREAAQ